MNSSVKTAEKTYTLKDILGICNVYQGFHKTWPTHKSTAEDFELAHIFGLSGSDLNRMLLTGSNGLEADPDYQKLKSLVLKHGPWRPNLSSTDPDFRLKMPDDMAERMINTVQVATGKRPTRSIGLYLPRGADKKILADAGLEKLAGIGTWIPTSDELLEYIGDLGVVYGNDANTVGTDYYLELHENNRLCLRYNKILGSRYITDLTPAMLGTLRQRITEQLQEQFGAPKTMAARAAVTRRPVAEAGETQAGDRTLQEELATLSARDGQIVLPAHHLTRYADIKRLLEKAGGRYVSNKKLFAFAAGIDCAAVLEQLVGGETVNFKKDFQFFATSKAEARCLCEAAGPLKGKRVLEPSAGDGAIADVAREMGANVVTVEAWNVNAIKLRAKGYEPIERDFLTVSPSEIGYFDAIIANPPFTKNQDIDHVMHMLSFLKPGGSLSVIMSTGWQTGTHKKHVAFREFLATQNVVAEPIAAGAFNESGTSVPTIRLDLTNYQDPRLLVLPDHEMEDEEQEAPAMA